jgi:hypothetical protein
MRGGLHVREEQVHPDAHHLSQAQAHLPPNVTRAVLGKSKEALQVPEAKGGERNHCCW